MKFAYLEEPPFNYVSETGAITGSDVELARYVFSTLEMVDVQFVKAEFADLLPGLARGEWQMTTGLFATSERRSKALFSRPVWALPDGLLVRSENAARIEGYSSIAKDDALTLAVIRDQAQHQSARDVGVRPEQIAVFETYADAAQAVLEGRVTAYASVARAHSGYLQQNANVELAPVVVPATEKAPAFGCFGFSRKDANLRDKVDQVLQRFLGSPAHRNLMRGFGFSDQDVDRIL